MYTLLIDQDVAKELELKGAHSPSLFSKLKQLENNPISNAIKTNIQAVGEYYVNAGRWCILFDINEEKEEVKIHAIMRDAKLHKILTGKIKA